jgi:hypothetical protein
MLKSPKKYMGERLKSVGGLGAGEDAFKEERFKEE